MIPSVELRPVEGDREAFLPLLLEADESKEMVRTYLHEGELLGVYADGTLAGEMLVIPEDDALEIRNFALAEEQRRRGIGRRAIDLLAERAATEGVGRLLVGTADVAVETHLFYLKCGFRYTGVRRGFFERYPEPVLFDGMVVRDMVLFDRTTGGPDVSP
ncbi:MAG: GNAT family N-acetyltransferase [Actinomycetota bacterium]